MTSDIELSAGAVRVGVAPADGGRLRQVSVGGTDLLAGGDDVFSWGSYPMVPYAGRVRRGRFEFDGRVHDLPVTMPPHAIHGVGHVSTWTVIAQTSEQIELELSLPSDDTWPLGGSAWQRITATPTSLRCELAVEAGDRPMPASLGWHPWFRKPSSIDFFPEAMYRRDDDGIAVAELVAVPSGPWDDCFVNHHPITIVVDDVEITLTSPCTDWVVYDQPAHATCIEPQTAPPDALNTWQHRLEPGERLAASYDWRFERRP